jgi:hypothetical protein
MPHRKSQLSPAPAIESLRQVLEREIVNTDHRGTRTERRRRKLHVQYINRMFAEFGAECQWDSDQRRVRQRGVNFEVGPALVETIASVSRCDVERVLVNVVDLR